MSWEFERHSRPVARKEYKCDAADCISDASLPDADYDAADLATIARARAEQWKILPGTRYVKVVGKWDGDFVVFRARTDMHEICLEYNLYPED